MTFPTFKLGCAVSALALALPAGAAQADTTDLIIATPQIPVHLDPVSANRGVNWRFTHNVLESLIYYNGKTGEFAPGLATEWRFVEPTVLELTIRDGVTCHNGEVFDANDVAIAFGPDRMLSEDAPGYAVGKNQFFPRLTKVEAVDDLTVRMTTDVADPLLPLRLSTPIGAVPCGDAFNEAASWESWGSKVIGTGPYMVDSFEPGQVNGFRAFDDYWGDAGLYNSFTFRVIPELGARVAGLLSGDFDIITTVTPDQFDQVNRDGISHVDGGPINNIRLVVYDQDHPALKDARIRRAMNLAIDRELLVETIFDGRTTIPNGVQHDTFGAMYVPEHKGTGYNPDLARKLIEEAGYDGEEISYRYQVDYYTGEVITAQVLEQMWKAVGLNIKLELKESWDEISSAKADPGRGVINYSATAVYPDPEGQLMRLFGPNGPFQRNGIWASQRFNAWGENFKSTDVETRHAAFERMLEIYETDAPGTYLHVLPLFLGVSDKLNWTAGEEEFMDFRASAAAAN